MSGIKVRETIAPPLSLRGPFRPPHGARFRHVQFAEGLRDEARIGNLRDTAGNAISACIERDCRDVECVCVIGELTVTHLFLVP